MKMLSFLLVLFSLGLARGQSTNTPVTQGWATNGPASFQPDPLSADLSRRIQPSVIMPLQPKPNEMSLGDLKVSGIAIEAAKTGQPLKLINPFSPPTNSSPEDNVVRDPFNGKVNGWKVFGVHF